MTYHKCVNQHKAFTSSAGYKNLNPNCTKVCCDLHTITWSCYNELNEISGSTYFCRYCEKVKNTPYEELPKYEEFEEPPKVNVEKGIGIANLPLRPIPDFSNWMCDWDLLPDAD